MRVRACPKNEWAAVFDIYNRVKVDELRFEPAQYTLLPIQQDAARLRELVESDIYVCEHNGVVAGYGARYGHEIRALFVLPEWRGQGVGKKLFEFLLSSITGPACLYVVQSNYPAKDLYEQYGFSVVDTFETTYNRAPVVVNKMHCANLLLEV